MLPPQLHSQTHDPKLQMAWFVHQVPNCRPMSLTLGKDLIHVANIMGNILSHYLPLKFLWGRKLSKLLRNRCPYWRRIGSVSILWIASIQLLAFTLGPYPGSSHLSVADLDLMYTILEGKPSPLLTLICWVLDLTSILSEVWGSGSTSAAWLEYKKGNSQAEKAKAWLVMLKPANTDWKPCASTKRDENHVWQGLRLI